jgi:disulfide bond formation protein DsbB
VSVVFSNPTRLFALALGVCGTALAGALVSQHVFDMQPCPWCILQRLLFAAIAVVAAVGLAWRTRAGAIGCAIGMDLLAALGVAAALWQHFVASSSTSCNLTRRRRRHAGRRALRVLEPGRLRDAGCAGRAGAAQPGSPRALRAIAARADATGVPA